MQLWDLWLRISSLFLGGCNSRCSCGIFGSEHHIIHTSCTTTMDSHHEEHQYSLISNSELCKEFSHYEPGVARINNGSFGSCPASIIAIQHEWQLRFLRQPDDFYFNRLQKGILEARAVIKNLINAEDIEEVSIVDNVTTAAAIVLQHICWKFVEGNYEKGDKVVMLNCTYGAVKKSIHAYIPRAGGEVIEVQLTFPVISSEEVINEFRKGLVEAKATFVDDDVVEAKVTFVVEAKASFEKV